MGQITEGKIEFGTRVVALLSNPKTEGATQIFLVGYGIYLRDEIPCSEAVGAYAEQCRATQTKAPLLQLDDGQEVYGNELLWGQAQIIDPLFAGKQIVHVDLEVERKMVRDANEVHYGQQEPDMDAILEAAKKKAQGYAKED